MKLSGKLVRNCFGTNDHQASLFRESLQEKRTRILIVNQAFKTGNGNDLATVAAQFLLSSDDYSAARRGYSSVVASQWHALLYLVSGGKSQPWKQGCHLPSIQDTRILNVGFTLHWVPSIWQLGNSHCSVRTRLLQIPAPCPSVIGGLMAVALCSTLPHLISTKTQNPNIWMNVSLKTNKKQQQPSMHIP